MSLYLFFLLHRRGESILIGMACSRINTNKQAHFKCCASAVLNSGDCVVRLDLACTVVYCLVVQQLESNGKEKHLYAMERVERSKFSQKMSKETTLAINHATRVAI